MLLTILYVNKYFSAIETNIIRYFEKKFHYYSKQGDNFKNNHTICSVLLYFLANMLKKPNDFLKYAHK